MAEKQNMQWMYEGPKSIVNREDYLLGKKIDKNFELYSDVVVKDRDEREDIFSKQQREAQASTSEGLPVLVARQEDPLAAIKLEEAKRRQAMLNNPALKMKAEKMLKKEFEKMKKKAMKKEMKKKRKKHRSSSSESEPEAKHKQHRSSSPSTKHRRHRSPSPEELHRRRRRSSNGSEKRHRRHVSSSPDSEKRRGRRRSPSYDSDKEHKRRRTYSSSSDKRTRSTSDSRRHHPSEEKRRGRSPSRSKSPIGGDRRGRERRPSPDTSRRPRSRSRESKHKARPETSSSSEEMARRLREMQENARWKEQVRKDNVDFARKELAKETDDGTNRQNSAFIKVIKQRTEGSTVAEKIKQNRHRLRIDRHDADDD